MGDNSLDSIISAIEHGQDPLQSSPQNSTANNSGLTSESRGAQMSGRTHVNDSAPAGLTRVSKGLQGNQLGNNNGSDKK
jgi:hypothetical protein